MTFIGIIGKRRDVFALQRLMASTFSLLRVSKVDTIIELIDCLTSFIVAANKNTKQNSIDGNQYGVTENSIYLLILKETPVSKIRRSVSIVGNF